MDPRGGRNATDRVNRRQATAGRRRQSTLQGPLRPRCRQTGQGLQALCRLGRQASPGDLSCTCHEHKEDKVAQEMIRDLTGSGNLLGAFRMPALSAFSPPPSAESLQLRATLCDEKTQQALTIVPMPPRRRSNRSKMARHNNIQWTDSELETSGIEVGPSNLRPEGAKTYQPRATPWDDGVERASSPERAAQWYGFVSPIQGSRINVQTDPMAMPWADMFWSLQDKIRRARVLVLFSPISVGSLTPCRAIDNICDPHTAASARLTPAPTLP